MWPTSDRFAEAVTGGATRSTSVVVYHSLVDYYNNAAPFATLPLVASQPGSITVDSTAQIRRTGTLNVVDADNTLLPLTVNSPMSPFGPVSAVYTGFTYTDGTAELVPVGVFTFTISEANLTAGIVTQITINDLSKVVDDHELSQPVTFAAGTDASTAILALLTTAYPDLDCSQMQTTNQPIANVTYAVGDSPWQRASDIAVSVGYELFVDQIARAQLRPVPDPATIPPVWTYSSAAGQGSLVSDGTDTTAELSIGTENGTDKARSHGIAESTSAGVGPFRGDAYDLNPQSPTYFYGQFGDRPIALQSAEIASQAAADAAAQGLLLQNVGALTQITFTGTVVAAHDASDVVAIDIPELGPEAQATFVMQSFTLPLGLDVMTATTRTRHTVT